MTSQPATLPAPSAGITYRLMRDLDDIPAMAAANAADRAAFGILSPVDEAEMRRTYQHLVNCDFTRDVLIAHDVGRTVGYVRTAWNEQHDGSRVFEVTLLVDPAAWGRGVARALLSWADEHHRRLSAEDPAAHPGDRPSWLEIYVFEGDREVEAAAEEAGYRLVRRGAEMLRDRLDDELPDVPLPGGFELRPPTTGGLRAFWEVSVEIFSDAFGEAVATETDWRKWRDDPRRDPSLTIVAYHGDEIAGYVQNILEPQPDGSLRGLLGGVATREPFRRRGLARALVARSLRLLRDRGATSAYLSVDLENPSQALTLYEACGFRVMSAELTYRRPLSGPWPEETV